ncbi:MAG: cytochrome bc complex cytochrome b subunit [Desulfurococcales archaeon]|nr:cytochrome bc complex cytochrome b subunit [Desulfurococcales archaeon]
MSSGGGLWGWLEERLRLSHLPFYRVPYSYMTLEFWLGAIVASSFMLLVITGLLLLFYYKPDNPVLANYVLITEKPFGRFLLTTHLYAAHAMIFSAIIHLFRNMYRGAYKKPRELVWLAGIITGLIMIQTAFFGYSLIGDKIAEEAVAIGSGLVANSFGPYWGKVLVALAFDIDEAQRYYRLLAMHIILAGLLGLLFMLHFGLFEQQGPQPSHEETGWKTKPERIPQDREDLAPWFPVNFLYMTFLGLGVWGLIVLLNAISQAAGFVHQLLYPLPIFDPEKLAAAGVSNPPEWILEAAEKTRPMPPWFLVYAFKIFQLNFLYIDAIGYSALLIFIIAMVLPPLVLAIFPFIDRHDSTHPLDRPIPTIAGGLLIIYLVQLTIWGALSIGYYSLTTTALIFLVPLLIVVMGYIILAKHRSGEPVGAGLVLAFTGIILLVFLAPGAWIVFKGSQGASEALWADIATMLIGIALAIGYVALLATSLPGGEKSQRTVQVGSKDVPLPLVILAVVDLFLLIVSVLLLALWVDPIANPAGATALVALLFLSAYGVVHGAYRAVVADKVPYTWIGRELPPHLLVYIAAIITAAILI